MPSLNLKDPEVYELAHRLASRRHTSATGAVREALREALQRDAADRSDVADRLLELSEASMAIDSPILSDDDLYDDQGLPR